MLARFLITTTEETTWQTDVPMLFLGEWCKLHARRHIWSKIDAEVVPYHWDDRSKLYRDYCYLRELYERIMAEVANRLNEIHRVNHSLRYWRILIGPWLGYFIQIVFDRWEMIQTAAKHYNISGTRVIEDAILRLVPNDMDDFSRLFIDDQWNQVIYGYLLEHWTNVHCERVRNQAPVSTDIGVPNPRINIKRRIRRCVAGMISKLLAIGVRPDEAFFIADYLPLRESFALQWQLGQIPRLWRQITPSKVAADIETRRWRLGDTSDSEALRGLPRGIFAKPSEAKNSILTCGKPRGFLAKEGDFEQALRALIPLQIPTAYLEGYGDLKKQATTLPWPKNPRFIFTSNSYHSDDVFKAWAAEKVEAGTPLVVGQHGGNYGVALWCFTEDHQLAISDAWLSWGWEDGKNKIKPVGNLKMVGRRLSWDPDGCALMVEMAIPRYSYHMYSAPVASQWLGYFEDQARFVDALPQDLRGQLLVRLYSQDYGWCQKQRWQDRFPQICLDDGMVPIASLIKKSRIYISTYNGTTFLESLAMNIPTIIFWNPKYWELRTSAQPYFDRLKEVGIFHETPESAATKVAGVWDDVADWWHHSEIQEARRFFCNRFSWVPEHPLRVLKEVLTSVKSGGLD